MFELHVIQEEFDPSIIGKKPTRVVKKKIKRYQMDRSKTLNMEISIRKNEISVSDSFVSLGASEDYTYYEIDP